MRPDDPKLKPSSFFIPQRPTMSNGAVDMADQNRQQEAVADLTRQQIDQIYQDDPNATMPVQDSNVATPATNDATSINSVAGDTTPPNNDRAEQTQIQLENENNPYAREHNQAGETAVSEQWQQYHSAWQNYYQQYFHRYYAGHIQQTQAALAAANAKSEEVEAKNKELLEKNNQVTPEEAVNTLRSQIRSKVTQRAKAVRKSRHFYPIAAACLVMITFMFLQYNRVLFAYIEAYTSPTTTVPDNIIVDPTTTVAVSDEPRLIIPKLSLDVPAIYENTMGKTNKETYDLQMAAMSKGVAWFGIPKANSHPGQIGNTVLSGHSSSEWFETGDYKFIFARLEQLNVDDTIYVNYKGVRYTYKVVKKNIVLPTDVKALQYDTDKPMLTLITCVPLGTAAKRLLVTAEQINPDPAKAQSAPSSSGNTNTAIPGQSSTFLDRITGN